MASPAYEEQDETDEAAFVEVCGEDELADGEKIAFEIDGRRVMLARVDGSYYAIDAVCTHERAFLDEGSMVGSVVFCPLHYSSFDVRTGCVMGPPADRSTSTHGVRVQDGTVLVSVEPMEVTETPSEPDATVRVEPVERPSSPQSRILDRVDSMDWLQRVTDRFSTIATRCRSALAPRGLLDLLHGRWLGHALHPALSDLPIGLWAGSFFLYLIGLPWPAVLLSLAGLASAVPAMVTGFADLTVTDGHDRRVGVLHGLAMSLAFLVQVSSPVAYFAGAPIVAAVLAGLGLVITVGGAFFGGHLVLARGAMVDHASPSAPTPGWRRTVAESELDPGGTAPVEVDGRTVLLHRSSKDGRISAIENACSHAGGPLSLGNVCDGVVSCPWHDSRFRLSDGAVVRGPATFNQPVLAVRVVNGWIEVRTASG